jgi:hypothetical protein
MSAHSTAAIDGLPRLRIIHHLARTGGTTICKCLAVMPEVALLSEIHPLGLHKISPLAQAKDWYGLLNQADIDRLGPDPDFSTQIRLIADRAAGKALRLIIRDWTHLDFTGPPLVPQPSYRLSIVEALSPYFDLVQVATVRHPIDEWESLRRRALIRGHIKLDAFLRGYRRFAEVCQAIGFVRYEDFCSNPDSVLQRLCAALAISYDSTWRTRWASYRHMTGDETARHHSGDLRLPRRRPFEPGLESAFLQNADYRPALELLGYDHPR